MILYDTAKRALAGGLVVTLADGEYTGPDQPVTLETGRIVLFETGRPRDARGRFRRPQLVGLPGEAPVLAPVAT